MGSKIIVFVCFLCGATNFGVLGQNLDVGKIFIGTQGNRSDPTQYTFNGNYVINIGTQSIPFSAVVFSVTGGTEVSKDDLIDVTCVNEFNGLPGYIQVSFDTVNLPAADAEGTVSWSFGPTSTARAAVVRCYGQSRNIPCPPTGTAGQPQPEFCPETSMSDPVTIIRTPAPVVSICDPVNRVPSFTANTYSGTFQVVLSEAVRGSAVIVSCQQATTQSLDYCQQPGVTCCQQSGGISVTQTTVPVGETTATMAYQITRTNSQNACIGVRCTANSAGQLPEGYLQYTTPTSQDSSSEGLFQTVTPQVYMEPQYLTVYNTSFQSLLYLDASANVAFQCRASVVSTLQEALNRMVPANIDCNLIFANATTSPMVTPTPTTTPDANTTIGNSTLPPITTTLPTPPVDPSSPWITIDNSFIVNSGNKFQVVRTIRKLVAIAAVQEIVVTTCCSTVTDASSAYSDLRVASITVANLVPRRNTTGGDTSGEPGDERFVVNPAYREFAPCPCDLTFQACDVNCCCDGECTDPEKETFSDCIQGRPGGLDPDPDLRSCRSNHFPKDNWFPLMCVEFESNAFLGRFYTNTAKLSSATEVGTNVYTYRETEPRFSDLAVVNGYTEGSNILTISSKAEAGNLPLPQHTSSGRCLDSAPVKFLRDSESTCTRTLTSATCSDLTPFSARSFVEPSSLYNPACPRSFSVSSTGRSLQNVTQRVNVQVNYHCLATTNMANYVKTTTTSFSNLVSPTTVYSFPPDLANVNCTDLCGGDADPACLNYNQGKEDSVAATLPPRCSGDTGFALHPTPTYNPTAGMCDNVVLEVRYNFTWAGQSITGLTADVVVGSVSIGGGEASVSQKFSATFVHDYSGPSNQTDNYQNLNTAYQRAGSPGYDFGKPVATGCQTTNLTSGSSTVNQNQVNQMAVFSPGIDGLCQNAKRRSLTFGDDLQASCVLRLPFNDINNCDSLKALVLNHLNVLMPANVIGRLGYNSPGVDDMWIHILREDPFPSSDLNTTPDPSATVATTATPSPTPENVTFDPLSVRGGVCRNIASGIHLEILYAETGRNNRYPLLEVVGAAVRYTVSNWSMSCVGGNSGRCDSNSPLTQPFLVTSSVQYTRVSPTSPQQPMLFYQIHTKEKCQSDTCYRFFEDFDTSTCHYDTCWHELFYPITPSYQGSEGVNYTRGFSLLFVLFILGYVSVAKPWK